MASRVYAVVASLTWQYPSYLMCPRLDGPRRGKQDKGSEVVEDQDKSIHAPRKSHISSGLTRIIPIVYWWFLLGSC